MAQILPDGEERPIFNDDLLINEDDAQFAAEQFPKIQHVLNHPMLKTVFVKYDSAANKARERVRLLGFITVVTTFVSLASVTTRPLWPRTPWTHWLAALIEIAGMLAAIVAIGGLWSWKNTWLKNRLLTERIRQWHFQLIVRKGKQIENSCREGGIPLFESEREKWFAYFLRQYRGKVNGLLSAIEDPVESIAWLHDQSSPYSDDSFILPDIFAAYEQLRFNHQYAYAVANLASKTDEPFWRFLKWPVVVKRAALSGASGACFVNALICSVFLVAAHIFGANDQVELYLRSTAIIIVLLGVSLRAVQEGLGIEGEIERYQEFRQRIYLLRDRFRKTSDGKERLRVMEEIEVAAVEEMQDFLRIHQKARFVL